MYLNFDFCFATQTQLGFSEIVYTMIVTAISTGLTMGASFGVGSIVSSLVNPAKQISSKFIGRMLESALGGAVSFTAPIVARAVVKEIGQEILLDPWIESTVSGLVRRAGGDAIWQMVLSSIAESGREALTGPLTNLINPSQSQQFSFMSNIESQLKPTVQDIVNAFNEHITEIKKQQEQRKEQLKLLGSATRVLSFTSLALGFTTSQFLGPVGALVYSTLVTYCFSEDISLKGIFKKIFNPVMSTSARNNREVDALKDTGIGTTLTHEEEFINYNKIYSQMRQFGPRIYLADNILPPRAPENIGETIASSWLELVNFIKLSLKDNDEVKQITLKGKSRLGQRISKFLFGTQSYLQSVWDNKINYKGKSFIRRGSQFVSREKLLEIYTNLKEKQQVFGKSWPDVTNKFSSFWAIRFDGEKFSDYISEFSTVKSVKEVLYEGLRSIFADFLELNKIQVESAFISRLLEPYRQNKGDVGFTDASSSRIESSVIFRIICEVRDLSVNKILNSAKKRGVGPLANLKISSIKDLAPLRAKLEEYLLDFFMSDLSGISFNTFAREKLIFDLEIFYAIYKNTPLQDRMSVSFRSIQRDLKTSAIEDDGNSYVSGFGNYKVSYSYHWGSMRTINAYLLNKVSRGEISKSDYIAVLKAGRKFCKGMGISPANPAGYAGHFFTFQMKFSQVNIEALEFSNEKILKRFFTFLLKQTESGRKDFLAGYFDNLRKSSSSFSMSTFSKDPYSMNLGFTKPQRLSYMQEFTNSIVKKLGTNHKSLQQLIKYAKYRKTDEFVSNDANLLEIIDPSKYNQQPSHEFIQFLALKNIPSIITTEPFFWINFDDIIYSGHIDFIQIEGKKIRIIDYKPDLTFDPDSKNIAKHFIDSIPQVAAYGIIFDMMFGISSSEFEIECVTFNENGYYLYDPYQALESSVEFYYEVIGKLPAWAGLLSKEVRDRITN
jgi:hypothetical protein